MKKFYGIIFYTFLFVLMLALSFACPDVDYDFWARLLQGYAVLETGNVLMIDPFSYVSRHAWIDHEWGAGVIFALVQNAFGYTGQIILKALLFFLIIFFMTKIIEIRKPENTKLYNILFFFLIIVTMENVILSGIRCQWFTFLFFTVFLYILERVRIYQKYKLLFLLPIFMLLWSNIHGGCVAGLGIILIYALGEALNKKPFKNYLFAFAASSSVIFINPYGFEYIKFLLHATTMKRPLIAEWDSISCKPALYLLKFKIFALLELSVFIGNFIKKPKNKKFDYTKCLLIVLTCFLALSHIKHITFFIITATVFLYDDFFFFFNSLMKKIRNRLNIKSEKNINLFVKIKEITVHVLILAEIFTLFGIYNKTLTRRFLEKYPVKVAEFIKINQLDGTILNKFELGSYLSYKLFPRNLICMDGRYEEVYYDETTQANWDFYNDTEKSNDIFKLHGIPDYIIVHEGDLIFGKMKNSKNQYTEIYTDDKSKNRLFVRKNLLKKEYIQPSDDEKYYIDTYFDRMFKFNLKK